MYLIILFIIPAVFAESVNTTNASQVSAECDVKCGCDKNFVYDYDQQKCSYVLPNATEKVISYNQDHDIMTNSRLATSIYLEGEQIFKGIMIAATIFVACAGACVIGACIYCCRINYQDRKLQSDVKALAKKLKRDYKPKKSISKPQQLQPIDESCNVVVADADLFVV